MSRSKDLIGVLKGVKSVGKKVVKSKKADLDNLVRGTSIQETVDSVAGTLTRVVKALNQIQNEGAKTDHRRPTGSDARNQPDSSSSSSSASTNSTSSASKGDSRDNFVSLREAPWARLPLARTSISYVSTIFSKHFGLRPSLFSPLGSSNSHFSSSSQKISYGGLMWNSPLNDAVSHPFYLSQERLFSSSSLAAKEISSGPGGRPPKPPTAAEIKKRLKARQNLPASARENRVPTVSSGIIGC